MDGNGNGKPTSNKNALYKTSAIILKLNSTIFSEPYSTIVEAPNIRRN